MYSFAHLVAHRDCYERIEIIEAREVGSSIDFEIDICESRELMNIKSFDLPIHFINAEQIVSAQLHILHKEKYQGDFITSVVSLYLQSIVRELIKDSTTPLQRGTVEYKVGTKKFCVPIEGYDYSNLLAASALQEGYAISEVQGSHYKIRNASGKTSSTSLQACSCGTFESEKDCIHHRLAKVFWANRPHLNYLLRRPS